jgi:putative membrane protein
MLLSQLQPATVGSDDIMKPLTKALVSALAFSALGIVLFALAFLIIVKVTPFSLRKEIEDDQNTALGIVIGAVIIGLSLIISSAIQG